MVILHNSVTGSSMKLAKRFRFPSKRISNYRGEAEGIVIIGRRFFTDENLWELIKFIENNKDKIKGVVIYDDKSFGSEFGASAELFERYGIEVLAVWDKVVSEEEIREMEVLISGEV